MGFLIALNQIWFTEFLLLYDRSSVSRLLQLLDLCEDLFSIQALPADRLSSQLLNLPCCRNLMASMVIIDFELVKVTLALIILSAAPSNFKVQLLYSLYFSNYLIADFPYIIVKMIYIGRNIICHAGKPCEGIHF